jgi:hypothetical protein
LGHDLLSPEHLDTTPATPPTDGDLITATGGFWQRLAIGTETYALKVVSGVVAWAQVAFSELTGALSAAQHGTLGSGADHTADLSANARVNVKKAGASVGIRRGVNLIEGANVSLTVTDDAGNEEVDVTVAVTGTVTPTWHNLLSATHPDTVVNSPTRGSLIYGNATPAWDELPVGGIGTYLVADGTDASWAPFPATGLSPVVVGSRNDIQNFGTTGDGNVLFNPWMRDQNEAIPMVMPLGGALLGITVQLNGDVGGVGDNITITLYRNGGPEALTVTLTGGAGTEQYAFDTGGIAFDAGDILELYGLKSGSVAARTCIAVAWGAFNV